jgi:transcriptional regulator with XRE-family HTH domain
MTPLARWLAEQMATRNLSTREASTGAGLDHGAVSRFMTGTVPAPRTCKKLARFFAVPEEFILQLAGHIEPPPDQTLFLKQLAQLTADWTADEKRTLVELARTLDRQRQPRA